MSTTILNSSDIERTLRRLSFEIIETNKNLGDVVLVGIAKGGVELTHKLVENIEKETKIKITSCSINIKGYRDDDLRINNKDKITLNLKGKVVIICDDVFQTGRSARAAIAAVIDAGRPERIKLLSLIDRGLRELPLKLDYVGKNIPTSKSNKIEVIYKRNNSESKVVME